MANPTIFVEAPRRRPRKGGIKAVANFVSAPRMFAAERMEWIAEGCTFPKDAPGLCWGEVIEAEKETEGVDIGESGLIFAAYAGVACYDLGSAADFEARARRLLEGGEYKSLEDVLAYVLGTVDPTPSDYPTWVAAIGEAESLADSVYPGMPILTMSRSDAVAAFEADVLVSGPDDLLYTPNGSPVLASGALDNGTFWISGDITVWQSEITATTVTTPTVNTAMALAERAYAIGIDCDFVRAYSVTPVVP
jgi:hypothetical protein